MKTLLKSFKTRETSAKRDGKRTLISTLYGVATDAINGLQLTMCVATSNIV